uniref:Putative secreted peptide n=1 Tax=Anopheles braziliensis TaxID=58242 RepID=A0A2M3ZNC8_9DIPT
MTVFAFVAAAAAVADGTMKRIPVSTDDGVGDDDCCGYDGCCCIPCCYYRSWCFRAGSCCADRLGNDP